MKDRIGIHWFRLDLRLNDNPSTLEDLIYVNNEYELQFGEKDKDFFL